MSDLLKAVNSIGDAFDAYKTHQSRELESVKAENAQLRDRIETIEAKDSVPRKSGGSDGWSKDHREHAARFVAWVRRPMDGHVKRQLEEAQHEMHEKARKEEKAVTIGSDPAGGYAVPEILDAQVEARVNTLNPFRQLVRVTQVGSSDFKALVSANEAGTGWVGEAGSRSETDTSRLFERAPTFGICYAYPKASEEAMQDVFFDVQSWLVGEIADGLAVAEATAIVSGDGSNKPTGFLATANAPVATNDGASPERDPDVIEFLTVSGSPQAITADDLIDLSLSIKERYLLDGSAVAWVMRRSTAAYIRKLKDDYGQYLWQSSVQAGQPNMLLGYPVALTDAMPAIGADAHPVAFGAWSRGYLLCDRSGMSITVDSNITTPGYTKFYVRRRVGGCVLNHEAIKVLKITD